MSLPPKTPRCSRRLRRVSSTAILCACLASPPTAVPAQVDGYRQPPQDIAALLSAPKPPLVSVAPGREIAALVEPEVFTRLEDLARPAVSLNGRRIDPLSHARRGVMHYSGLSLLNLGTGETRRLSIADDISIGYPEWSPRGDRLAFAVFRPAGVELWHAGTEDAIPYPLTRVRLNPAGGRSFVWMPDGHRILCRVVSAGADALPGLPSSLPGPVVMEGSGPWGSSSDNPNTRRDPRELALFDYFMRSRLAFADTRTGELSTIGEPDFYGDFAPSPDGRFILISRLPVPDNAAPPRAPVSETFELWSADGRSVQALSPSRGANYREGRSGRRGFAWRHTAPATLHWIEDAVPDDGPGAHVTIERIMVSPAPFTSEPREVFRSELRITGIDWIDDSSLAIVHEYDGKERRAVAWLVDFAPADTRPLRMWSRHIDDRYGDPGRPITKRNSSGLDVVVREHGSIFLSARGATPHGERPFVSRWSLDTMQGEVLWRSREGRYETALALLGNDDRRLFIRHESSRAPPNYAIEDTRLGVRRELTSFRLPAAESFRVTKEVITFPRGDGLTLQATLYLPEDRAENERLPLVLWAYPRTYANAESAGQVSGSGDRFSAFDRAIPAFLAMRGFAVMDQVSMPIVSTGNALDNTFSAQVVASARAAIEKAVEMGVADRDRVGVAGHSYGAFMTVTLLAHSHLFKAGVALSGAYNRTLTPFGFQTERRTLWEAPGMYIEMSPFMYANRIEAPLLLIHGGQDENVGTSPMQSERLFQAIRGQGGTAKLVMLPYEGHVYRARESVLHSAAEMLDWFSLHLRRESKTAHSSRTAVNG